MHGFSAKVRVILTDEQGWKKTGFFQKSPTQWVLLGLIGFNLVLLGFIGFYWVLLGLIGFN